VVAGGVGMGNATRKQGVSCAGCGSQCYDSTYSVRVICTECTPNLDFCLTCFSSGVIVGQHRANHPYRFEEECPGSKMLGGEWNQDELVQLLEGLEQFGYGNWTDVACYVDTKNPTECRNAANQYFVNGPIARRTYLESERGRAIDHTIPASPDKKPAWLLTPGGQLDISVEERIQLGWLPVRDEYEVEFANDSESMVAILDPGRNEDIDEDLDTMLKVTQVEMYQAKLRERKRRRQVARDFGLVKEFCADEELSRQGIKKPRKDNKAELLERLRLSANFQTCDEHTRFIASISRERDLRGRIRELTRYRKNGIRRLRDAEDYEEQRSRRNRMKKLLSDGGDDGSPAPREIPPELDLDYITSIIGLPGYDMLSQQEKRLCTSLRLHPNLYISYKTCLIRDHLHKRRGQIPRPLHPAGLDKNHKKKIFNFLVHSGWISAY